MTIKTLLIDDEISALRTLRGMLRRYFPEAEVVAMAGSVNEAYRMALLHTPDVVFLDIEMPPFGSGFDFLKKCEDLDFGVIFTTAYPNYAIKAINAAQPWAYLLKPYRVEDLKKALAVAQAKLKAKDRDGQHRNQQKVILIPDARKGNALIRALDILYCKADGGTTEIFFEKRKTLRSVVASRTLKDIEEQLPGEMFCRCHHSYVINLHAVERYERTGRNGVVHLRRQTQVPISVGKMEDFANQVKNYLELQ